MKKKNVIQTCKKFKVDTGRAVVCVSDGIELFGITREACSPTEADAMTHYIVDVLNAKKDFKKYYEKYMR